MSTQHLVKHTQIVFPLVTITNNFAGQAQTTINELQRSLRSNPAVPPERRRHRRSRSESPTQSYNGYSRSPSPRGSSPRGYRYVNRTLHKYVSPCKTLTIIQMVSYNIFSMADPLLHGGIGDMRNLDPGQLLNLR